MKKYSVSVVILFAACLLCVQATAAQKTKRVAAKTSAAAKTVPKLSVEQNNSMLAILAESKKQSVPLFVRVGLKILEINQNLLSEKPDSVLLEKDKAEFSEAFGKAVLVEIDAAERMLKILAPEQKRLVAKAMERKKGNELFEVILKMFKLPEE